MSTYSEDIIVEMKNFSNGFYVHSIDKIHWWLLKYSDEYKNIIKQKRQNYIKVSTEDGLEVTLPPIDECKKHNSFLDLYRRLEEIADYHNDENYFKKEMTEFINVRNSAEKLDLWLKKNERFGAEKYVLFLLDYLDYSENPWHLNVHVPSVKDLSIYIDRKDFQNTVEFLETFNAHYWRQDKSNCDERRT